MYNMLEILGFILKNIALRIMRFVFVIITLPFLVLGAALLTVFLTLVLPLAALFGPDDWFDHKKVVKDVPPEVIID